MAYSKLKSVLHAVNFKVLIEQLVALNLSLILVLQIWPISLFPHVV